MIIKIKLVLMLFVFVLVGCTDDSPETLNLGDFDEYGIDLNAYQKVTDTVQPEQNISSILSANGLSYTRVDSILIASKSLYNISMIKSGNKYTTYFDIQTKKLEKFIYEINPIDFYIIDLEDSIKIEMRKKDAMIIERIVAGKIKSSLYSTLSNLHIDEELAIKLSEIFAWEIDFYRLQNGDEFKVVFDEIYVDGEYVRINKIMAAEFINSNEEYFAFGFNQDNNFQYFNDEGKSLRKAFLQSPLKFSRITSGYSLKRFHPVQKRFKSHLGTDYAAPQGTPIFAVGDGNVVEATYKQFNGNYIKIKHNSTYETQYLHMSRFGKGIHAGSHISQGQVIGYVGSTGLATGPHVCFRFWKNNQQVDHRREKFPPSFPVNKENESEFFAIRDYYKKVLSKIDNFKFQNALANN